MSRAGVLSLELLLLGSCVVGPGEPGGVEASASSSGTNAAPTTTGTAATFGTTDMVVTGHVSTTTGSGTSSGSGGEDSTRGFLMHVDMPSSTACDVWAQNCGPGQKCVAYASAPGSLWEDTKCIDIVPDPGQFNEPCTVAGHWTSGEDTCDKGLMCLVSVGLSGICLPLCQGSEEAPICQLASQYCQLTADTSFAPYLCHIQCDPLIQDCPTQQVCLPDYYWGDRFTCYPASDTARGSLEPCVGGTGSCQAGLVCIEPALISAQCDPRADGCCTPFCQVSNPECPGADQACMAYFLDPAPPEYADVGLCQVP
jgi:hypothetical protein